MGGLATSPINLGGSPRPHRREQNQKWPTTRRIGYVSPTVRGGRATRHGGWKNQQWPTTRRMGHVTQAVSAVPKPSPQETKAGYGPQVCALFMSPVPSRGSATPRCRGRNQQWPTSGCIGYVTSSVWGVPDASVRGTKQEVAHKWENWLHDPLPFGGSPRLWSGGQNPLWPTIGRIGYVSPAVQGVPNISKRGEINRGPQVGVLGMPPLPCAGPQRFSAGDTITNGPQLGKVAT